MDGAVFLSAGVPDARREREYAQTADVVAIGALVNALVHVVLGRRLLVWGGHPAITPMVLVTADDIGVDYGSWVKLYQSSIFKESFPEENARFQNVTYTQARSNEVDSLQHMRERMFTEQPFSAAVFAGGMTGVLSEADLFRTHQPHAAVLSIASTGGAALVLADNLKADRDLYVDLDYVGLLHRRLGVDPRERRYPSPADQPRDPGDRLRP